MELRWNERDYPNEKDYEIEVFDGSEPVIHSGKALIEKLNKDLNERIDQDELVSERDVCIALGIDGLGFSWGRDDWGWSKGKGFHKFTERELSPDRCPCCGQPWPKDSD